MNVKFQVNSSETEANYFVRIMFVARIDVNFV